MNAFNKPYTKEELHSLPIDAWPERGDFCPNCQTTIPRFQALTKEDEERIRKLSHIEQIKELRLATGCNLRWGKIWALHPKGPQEHKQKFGPPCPYCGEDLFTKRTKQCLECGWDWHDPLNPVRHKTKREKAAEPGS